MLFNLFKNKEPKFKVTQKVNFRTGDRLFPGEVIQVKQTIFGTSLYLIKYQLVLTDSSTGWTSPVRDYVDWIKEKNVFT